MNNLKTLASHAPYNYHAKKEWRKKSMSFLRKIAKEMGMTKADHSIRFCEGGVAVPGEAVLHHDKVYVQLSESGAMVRSCKSQKDYVGGQNLWPQNEAEFRKILLTLLHNNA
jgi:hypothetical protein